MSASAPVVTAPPASRAPDRRAVIVIASLLLVHLLFGISTACALSVTHDEYWHLPVGILNLRTWRFDYEPLNPPLTRLVSAAATSIAMPDCYQGPVELSTDPSSYGLKFLRLTGARHQTYYIWGRVANLSFSLISGVILAVWSWQWWGRGVACLTTLLWCTEPTVLAHASLVTPDAGLVCLTLTLWYVLWCYFQKPVLGRAVLCGLVLGLAQLTKFTAVMLVPLACAMWLAWFLARGKQQVKSRRVLCGHLILMLLVALLTLDSGYGWESVFSTLNQVQPHSATVKGWIGRWPVLGQFPLPFPKSYLIGLDAQKHVMESQHAVYLDGAWSVTGFRFYFLWALLYKLPHVWQALCLGGLARVCYRRDAATLRGKVCFIAFPAAVLIATASLSGMQLGVRYVLPVYPFLCLLAGSCLAPIGPLPASRWRRRLLIAVVLLAPWSLRFHPQHLAYFNELGGGPEGGVAHLLDSNLDWGQDLLELKQYVEKHADRRWGIAYFGSVPPGELGLHYDLPPAREPHPGWYAISVNYVQGRPHVVFNEPGQPQPVGLDEYGYFRAFQPVKRIGASILIFQIRPSDLMRWQTP
ncbi:MAG: glycosyltransferase family 39 protein [Planctomycetota bacterium]